MTNEEFTPTERRILRALDTPRKVQDFLDGIPINHEPEGDTCLSPRRVLRERRAHCIEGAMLAAAAFRFHGAPALVVDLTASPKDQDHVIAVFRRHGHWGAVSKTNHAVLRWRDPVFRTIRELVLSYFNEYVCEADGTKSLRSWSRPVDLSRFDRVGWMTREDDVWEVPEYLCRARHHPILSRAQLAELRRADAIELEASMRVEWPAPTAAPGKIPR